MHPWRLVDSTRQTSHEVEHQLQAEIAALEVFVETHGLPVKKTAVDKVRKQLAGVSALVDFWWQGVWHDVQHMALTPMWRRWMEEVLLPLMYWQQQAARTRCPRRKAKMLQACKALQATFETHPTDPEAGAGGPCGLASVGGGACPDLSAGLIGRRRSQRLSIADASQSSWLTQAPL